MKRRIFIKNISLSSLTVPIVINGIKMDVFSGFFSGELLINDRVLVIVRLNGGNDGLNTIVPLDSYDNLMIHRPKVLLPEKSVLKISDVNGLHPILSGMKNLFDEGQLSVFQNVGYENQNRSHFRSTDIWSRGLMDPAETTGWLGRKFDNITDNFPNDYPNDSFPDPFAISMGYEVSATCQGHNGNFSHTVNDPFAQFQYKPTTVKHADSYYGSNLNFLETMIRQTNQYNKVINKAAEQGTSNKEFYDEKNSFGQYLSHIVRLISGGLKTKVYILTINGFDTHGGQLDQIDTTKGLHAGLLETLSEGIASFQKDLKKAGIQDRVLGMTFSEFGRQISTNENNGTDHGDAGPMFLFGSKVNAGIIGKNPVIEKVIEDQAGIPFEFDFRDIYASVLNDWFQINESDIEKVFSRKMKYEKIINS